MLLCRSRHPPRFYFLEKLNHRDTSIEIKLKKRREIIGQIETISFVFFFLFVFGFKFGLFRSVGTTRATRAFPARSKDTLSRGGEGGEGQAGRQAGENAASLHANELV